MISKARISVGIFIIILFVSNLPMVTYGAGVDDHVIYEVTWLSDNSGRVTLKWSDDRITTPIMITSWRVDNEKKVTVKYKQGQAIMPGFNSRTISDDDMHCPCIFELEEDLGANTITEAVFPDLPNNAEGKKSIIHLYDKGIINGYVDGTFGPIDNVSRAEFAKMLYLTGEMTTQLISPITFSDVSESHWAKNYIYTLAAHEIVEGKGNNLYDPNGTITMGEVLTILDRSFVLYNSSGAYGYSLDKHWSNEYFLSMVDKGIVLKKDSYYYPYSPSTLATREQCAILLSRILMNYHEVKG